MKKYFDHKLGVDVILVGQSDYFISTTGEILTTTLGSCISICLFDKKVKIGGMNHFMLPRPLENYSTNDSSSFRYGSYAIEVLINGLMKLGADRRSIKAKIFGGANMFSFKQIISKTVGEQNIDFAKYYLESENIPIISLDVGKNHGRKIYFNSANGHVKLFRANDKQNKDILNEEKKVLESLNDDKNLNSENSDEKITLF